VNVICPGSVVTWGTNGKAIWENIQKGMSEEEAVARAHVKAKTIPLGRAATVDDVAKAAAFLASSQSDYMTGQAINIDGGFLMAH
jgi:meso-butanediol dehydrogenase/(S,S)-butanediol dehydrogenase/diacetyl reductase